VSALFPEEGRPERPRPKNPATVPPYSAFAEQGVLGSMLLDNRVWSGVAELVGEADFYVAGHAEIWTAASRLIQAGRAADTVTVFDALGSIADECGGLVYLQQLVESVPSTLNARNYAEIVRERSVQRQVAALALELRDRAMDVDAPTGTVGTAVDAAVTALLKLLQGAQQREPEPIEDLMLELLDEVQALAEGKRPAISTGFVDLDEATAGGGRPGEFWVVGARPSMGKSAFVLTLSLMLGEQDWALMLSQEDSKLTLAQRAVANLGGINLADIRNPAKVPDEHRDEFWNGLVDGAEKAKTRKLLIDDQGALTLADVRRKIQQAQRRAGGKLKVVIVDYLQLMTGTKENRNQLLGEICFGLQALAKEFGVWIILCSQLSREADKRQGLPHLSDLRDSGDIEAAAHVVALLYREARRKPTPENKHWAQCELAKNKNGPTCTVNLFFDGARQRFASWTGPVPRSGGGVSKGSGGGLN
jgi:replicative DNA helicase